MKYFLLAVFCLFLIGNLTGEEERKKSPLRIIYKNRVNYKKGMDKKSRSILRNYLKISRIIRQYNNKKDLNLLNQVSLLLTKTAPISPHKNQQAYLLSLARDINKGVFKESGQKWMETEGNGIDLVIDSAKNLQVSIFKYHLEMNQKIEKYISSSDRVLEELKIKNKYLNISKIIQPILVADLIYSNNFSGYILVSPPVYAKGFTHGFKIIVFRNILLSHFNKVIKPI